MLVTLAEIEQQARMLSARERAQFAEILLESLHEAPLSEILDAPKSGAPVSFMRYRAKRSLAYFAG
jgi:hypothetical protein